MKHEDARRPHVCLVSTADWDAPLWTNKQFMARELAREIDVTYIGSIGLRRPTLTRRDVRRILDRLRPGRHPSQPVPERVTVQSPRIVPVHSRLTAPLNRRTLRRSAGEWIDDDASCRILWTYSPVVYDLDRVADRVVYHAVDLLGSYPGIDAQMIDRAEAALSERCDVAIASSEVVADHLAAAGFRRIELWPNVADVEPYANRAGRMERKANRVVFGGNITPYKVDLGMLVELATTHPHLEIILCGPTDEGGAGEWREVTELRRLGVSLPGTMSLDQLAELYASASVGVIPYVLNDYTRGVNPLKLYEYLAGGLAVVSTRIPSVDDASTAIDADDLVIVDGAAAFCAAVARASVAPSSEAQRRRSQVADAHSWTGRGAQARALVEELC